MRDQCDMKPESLHSGGRARRSLLDNGSVIRIRQNTEEDETKTSEEKVEN
jgi:hypothetical protein